MNTAEIIRFSPDQAFDFDADRPSVLKCKTCEVALCKTHKLPMYGKKRGDSTWKLMLVFRVVTEGPDFGKNIYRCFNIKGITKRGEIIPKGWHSDFVREYSRLFGMPRKLRDIGTRKFKNKVFMCSVRTVTKDSRQRSLPEDMRYSVIDELLEITAGGV